MGVLEPLGTCNLGIFRLYRDIRGQAKKFKGVTNFKMFPGSIMKVTALVCLCHGPRFKGVSAGPPKF